MCDLHGVFVGIECFEAVVGENEEEGGSGTSLTNLPRQSRTIYSTIQPATGLYLPLSLLKQRGQREFFS